VRNEILSFSGLVQKSASSTRSFHSPLHSRPVWICQLEVSRHIYLRYPAGCGTMKSSWKLSSQNVTSLVVAFSERNGRVPLGTLPAPLDLFPLALNLPILFLHSAQSRYCSTKSYLLYLSLLASICYQN
jgi:hypothetical protein